MGKTCLFGAPFRLIEFCNFVNSGAGRQLGGPNGMFYLKVDTFHTEVTGLPDVPADYQDYLLKEPIITVVNKHHMSMSDVVVPGQANLHSGLLVGIPVGKREGIRVGMEFFRRDEQKGWSTARIYVVLVAEKTSLLLITGLDGKEKKMFPIGISLSSDHPYYRDARGDNSRLRKEK